MNYIKEAITASIFTKKTLLEDESLLKVIDEVAKQCIEAFRRGNRVLLAGNGGSAADAQHIAAEFVSRFMFDRPGLPSAAFTTDTSMLTAIGNDYGYENLFLRQLQANSRPGDLFIGITTSGRSPNILKALAECKNRGVQSVALTGFNGVETPCDYTIAVPSTSTPRIQECHILIGHIICGIVENTMFEGVRA